MKKLASSLVIMAISVGAFASSDIREQKLSYPKSKKIPQHYLITKDLISLAEADCKQEIKKLGESSIETYNTLFKFKGIIKYRCIDEEKEEAGE